LTVTLSQSPNFLLLSQAAAAAFAAARLLHFRLRRRFPLLFSYFLVVAFLNLVLSVLPDKSSAYFNVYFAATPLELCAAAMAVFEMCVLIFRDYPGLRTVGRWALQGALILCVFAAILIDRAPYPGESTRTRWLFNELKLDRSVHFGLAMAIIILLVFLSRYPLKLDRNTYVATGFFSAIFLAEAAVQLVDTLTPHLLARYADYSEVAYVTLCFLGCGVMLRTAEGLRPVRVPVNKSKETELLQQLESMNELLSRSIRK
jgi:hypothetical protein